MDYELNGKELALRYLAHFGDKKPSELGYGLSRSYTCPVCNGSGNIKKTNWRREWLVKCELCNGAGELDHNKINAWI